METITEKYMIINGLVGDIMTQEELNKMIDEIIISQEKPKSTGNSHKRKQWENRKYWRLCTIGKSCKIGKIKTCEAAKIKKYNIGKIVNPLCVDYTYWSSLRYSWSWGMAGVYNHNCDTHYKKYSYNSKTLRQRNNRYIRHYKGEIGDYGRYRRMIEYNWDCV